MSEPLSPHSRLVVTHLWDGDPAVDLAVEEALLRAVAAGAPPTLLAYGWRQGAVVLGRGQSTDGIDLDCARDLGLFVVRRSSGGTAIVHQGDLALSLVLPEGHPWSSPIPRLYDRFLDVIADALVAGGMPRPDRPPPPPVRSRSPICFQDNLGDTLALDGLKVVGCAQVRRRGAVLVHAMFVLTPTADIQAAIFRTTPDRIRRVIGTLPATVGPREHLAVELGAALANALGLTAIAEVLPALPSDLTHRLSDPHWVPVRIGWPLHSH